MQELWNYIDANGHEENFNIHNMREVSLQMEKEQEYETKAFWFGRGILAKKENRIEELKPIKD